MAERLYVLRTGTISMPKRWIRVGGSDEAVAIPVLAFLVVAGDRLILVDCGCSPVVAEDPTRAWGKLASLYHPQMGRGDLIDARIRQAGFEVGDITDVIVTHLHMDHVGGLRLLPHHPRIWVQRAEHRWGGCPDSYAAGGYYREEFDLPGLNLQLLDGDATIADGVRCVLTAGHTPGHQSVLVRLPTRLTCIVGDAAYNRRGTRRAAGARRRLGHQPLHVGAGPVVDARVVLRRPVAVQPRRCAGGHPARRDESPVLTTRRRRGDRSSLIGRGLPFGRGTS